MRDINWLRQISLRIILSTIFLLALNASLTQSQAAEPNMPAVTGFSLRFYGNGYGDIDRVKIRIDAPAVPADIGAQDFTIEFWIKASLANNPGSVNCNTNDGWITGNIILDRDIFFGGDYGDFGISLHQGRIAFGVSQGSTGTTLCGSTNVANNSWHHIAITRNQASGQLRIYVDGQLDGQGTGPAGNISYRNDRQTSYNDDPFMVIGAEKHDVGSAYPSFDGLLDELRLSNTMRYASNFTVPTQPFSTDANTAALYHLDEGPAGNCSGTVLDTSGASGGPSHGVCNLGGSPDGPEYSTDVPFAPDTTAPTYSQIAPWPMDTIANITWSTNEPANSQVIYGTTNPPGSPTTPTTSFVNSHAVSLSGLLPETTYYYRVISQDPSGNSEPSNVFQFQTLRIVDVRRLYIPSVRR